jgi:hypothetical protein
MTRRANGHPGLPRTSVHRTVDRGVRRSRDAPGGTSALEPPLSPVLPAAARVCGCAGTAPSLPAHLAVGHSGALGLGFRISHRRRGTPPRVHLLPALSGRAATARHLRGSAGGHGGDAGPHLGHAQGVARDGWEVRRPREDAQVAGPRGEPVARQHLRRVAGQQARPLLRPPGPTHRAGSFGVGAVKPSPFAACRELGPRWEPNG